MVNVREDHLVQARRFELRERGERLGHTCESFRIVGSRATWAASEAPPGRELGRGWGNERKQQGGELAVGKSLRKVNLNGGAKVGQAIRFKSSSRSHFKRD